MKKLYAFALASGLALLGACSNEEPLDYDPTPIDESGTIGYLRIEFPETETRAATGAEVTEAESNIEEACFVFSYKDGTYKTAVVRKDKQDGDNAWWVDHNGTGNRCAIIRLSKMPQSVAVIVNDGLDYTAADLNSTSGTSNTFKYTSGGKTYFRMSSPRYYAGTAHTLSNQTPITGNMLFKDEGEAERAAEGSQTLSINVEHYVAKINIKADYTKKLENGKLNPFESKTDKGVNNATIAFEPKYTFLTAYTTTGQRIKKLDAWDDLATELQKWSGINNADERWSGVCRKTTTQTVTWPTLNQIQGGTIPFGHEATAYNTLDQDIYAFDNYDTNYAHKTSVVVVGQYTVTKNGATFGAADGTFWLVAFEDKFEVYDSEKAALEAMGGAEGDVLVPDEVYTTANPSIPASTDNRWDKWTGWMKIKDKNIVTRCVKFDKGMGYYAEPLYTYKDSEISHRYVVRNHFYNVNIKGIQGMGVGIPDPDYPIIPVTPPDPTEQNYYLHMSITVQPWRTINNDVTWE